MSLFKGENVALGSAATVQSPVTGNYNKVPATFTVDICGLGAASASQTVFVSDGAYVVDSISCSFGTASTSGTLQVEKATGTQAVAAGTNILTGTVSLAGTANTTLTSVAASPAFVLVSNSNTFTLAQGDRLNLIFGGTMTNLANLAVTIQLRRA